MAKEITIARLAVLLGALSYLQAGHATPVLQQNVPDFYQHQNAGNIPFWDPSYPGPAASQPSQPGFNSGNWWESNAGWCAIASWTDIFYALDQRGLNGLYTVDASRTWQQQMQYGIEAFELQWYGTAHPGFGTFDFPVRNAVQNYVDSRGFGNSLVFNEFQWNAASGTVNESTANGTLMPTSFDSMLDLYKAEIAGSAGVVIRLEGDGDWLNWGGNPVNFHMIAGVGIDDSSDAVWFADPNDTIHGVGWGNQYQASDPLPVGPANYGFGTLGADGDTFATGFFAGAHIAAIYTLSPLVSPPPPDPTPATVPEPGTYALLCAALLGWAASMRRKQVT